MNNKLIQIALVGVALSQLQGCATAVVGGAATGTAVALDRRPTKPPAPARPRWSRAFRMCEPYSTS